MHGVLFSILTVVGASHLSSSFHEVSAPRALSVPRTSAPQHLAPRIVGATQCQGSSCNEHSSEEQLALVQRQASRTTDVFHTTQELQVAQRNQIGSAVDQNNCQYWCATNSLSWQGKCAWKSSCNECPDCDELAPAAMTLAASANCQPWCAKSTAKSWSVKCGWARNCNECDECNNMATEPTEPPTPAPEVTANCLSWCAKSPQTWDVKCSWGRNCNECSVCESVTATPTPAPPPTKVTPNCQSSCAKSPKTWDVKCKWAATCGGCSVCESSVESEVTAPPTPAPPPTKVTPNCQSWCAKSPKTWDVKCSWASTCNECSVCSTMPTKAPTPHFEDLDHMDSAPTPAPEDTADCQSWCANSPKSWDVKCGWSSNCNACKICPTTAPTPPPTPWVNCQPSCAKLDLAAKCDWTNNDCNECPDCPQRPEATTVSTTDATPTCRNGRSAVVKPHIIMIMADDLGVTDLGFTGSMIDTPVLDQLAKGSVLASQFRTYPFCSASRLALLTGRNPYKMAGRELTGLGVDTCTTNRHRGQYLCPWESDKLFSSRMQQQGYFTALVGKYHFMKKLRCYNGTKSFEVHTSADPSIMGWNHFSGLFHGVAADLWSHNDWVGTHGESLATDQLPTTTTQNREHQTDYIARKSIEVINGLDASKDSLFMWVSFTAPHTQNPKHGGATRDSECACSWDACGCPFTAPEPLVTKYLDKLNIRSHDSKKPYVTAYMAAYFAMVEQMDTAIGRIVQALEDKGIRDNSLILFMSDNGGPDIGSVNGPLRGGKGVSYEGGLRAPFFMNWPGCLGVSPSPVINSEAFNMVDLYNTLLSLSPNADLSSNIESRSVFNQFTEATGVIRYGNRYEEDFFRASEVPIEKKGRSSAHMAAMSPFNIAAIYDNFKLVLSRKNAESVFVELFDLKNDPNEDVNLVHEPETLELKVTKVNKAVLAHLLDEVSKQVNLVSFTEQPLNDAQRWYVKEVAMFIKCSSINTYTRRMLTHNWAGRRIQPTAWSGDYFASIQENRFCKGNASVLHLVTPMTPCDEGFEVSVPNKNNWCVTQAPRDTGETVEEELDRWTRMSAGENYEDDAMMDEDDMAETNCV